MANRLGPALVIALVLACVAYVVLRDDDGPRPGGDDVRVELRCSDSDDPPAAKGRDVELGPVVLLGGGGWVSVPPPVGGYEIPVAVRAGQVVALALPSEERAGSGLVYGETGAEGEDVVRFTACPAGRTAGRTRWSGRIVTDAPRCLRLVATLKDGSQVRGSLPLGRGCEGGGGSGSGTGGDT